MSLEKTNCVICGVVMPYRFGRPRVKCVSCKAEYHSMINKNAQKQYKKWNSRLYEKIKSFGVKKEIFYPIDVFNKYNLTCSKCNCATPLEARGKNLPNSPEIVHRIPFEFGGNHTMDNVMLLCRQCNIARYS